MAIRIVVSICLKTREVKLLTYVYGIGRVSSAKILDKAGGADRDLKVKDWTDDQAAKIREIIAEYKVEGDLRSEVQLNIAFNGYRLLSWCSSSYWSSSKRSEHKEQCLYCKGRKKPLLIRKKLLNNNC